MKRRTFFGALLAPLVAAFAPRVVFEPPWVEEELYPSIDLARSPATPWDVTIEPMNPEFFQRSDVVHVPRTGESFVVTAKGDHALTVVRGVGSKAAAIEESDSLWIVGGSYVA